MRKETCSSLVASMKGANSATHPAPMTMGMQKLNSALLLTMHVRARYFLPANQPLDKIGCKSDWLKVAFARFNDDGCIIFVWFEGKMHRREGGGHIYG